MKAAAEWLRSQPQVDGARIGIWGGSYGGYLTALALARDSGLFAAGVDIHGVEKAADVAWNSSPVSAIATWRSPVLLIHGDDDRNVRFGQTVDLAQRLRRQGVEFEELVIPDDTHHFLKHANWLRVNHATAAWFEKRLAGPTSR